MKSNKARISYSFETDSADRVISVTWRVSGDRSVYFTDKHGEGVFKQDAWGNTKQLVGTCQFCVRGLAVASARSKIRNLMF